MEVGQELRDVIKPDKGSGFFHLEVPGMRTAKGRQRVRLWAEVREGARFDLQFGRVLACHLMNAGEKINWKQCVLRKEEEDRVA